MSIVPMTSADCDCHPTARAGMAGVHPALLRCAQRVFAVTLRIVSSLRCVGLAVPQQGPNDERSPTRSISLPCGPRVLCPEDKVCDSNGLGKIVWNQVQNRPFEPLSPGIHSRRLSRRLFHKGETPFTVQLRFKTFALANFRQVHQLELTSFVLFTSCSGSGSRGLGCG